MISSFIHVTCRIRYAFFGNPLWKGSTKQNHAFLHFRFCFVLCCLRVFCFGGMCNVETITNHGPETQAQLVNQHSAEPASIGFKKTTTRLFKEWVSMQSRMRLQRKHFACGLPTLYVFAEHRMSTSVDSTSHLEVDRNVRSMLSPASALRSALHHQKRWHSGHLLHACDQSHVCSDSSLRYFH